MGAYGHGNITLKNVASAREETGGVKKEERRDEKEERKNIFVILKIPLKIISVLLLFNTLLNMNYYPCLLEE